MDEQFLIDLISEYTGANIYVTKNHILPYAPYIDSAKYIDLIIKQLNKIKGNEPIAKEFIRLFHYKHIWRNTISDLINISDNHNSFRKAYEEELLCELFKNKKTLSILAYLYNLDYVYCEKGKIVFDLDKEKYIKPNDNYNEIKDKTEMTEQEYHRFFYGNTSASKNALKQKLKRATMYLIDNEPELLDYLGITIDENGNMHHFRYSKTLAIQVTYFDLIKQIKQFLNTSTIKNPIRLMDFESNKQNDTKQHETKQNKTNQNTLKSN